jgi:hypothetical protein
MPSTHDRGVCPVITYIEFEGAPLVCTPKAKSFGSGRTVRTLAHACIVALFFGGIICDDADASTFHGGGGAANNSGNGKNNRNSWIINSPSVSHDLQHIRNVNVDGNTVTPAAFCKRPVRRCKIVQSLVVYDR